jgi:hypothetical protein
MVADEQQAGGRIAIDHSECRVSLARLFHRTRTPRLMTLECIIAAPPAKPSYRRVPA